VLGVRRRASTIHTGHGAVERWEAPGLDSALHAAVGVALQLSGLDDAPAAARAGVQSGHGVTIFQHPEQRHGPGFLGTHTFAQYGHLTAWIIVEFFGFMATL
jgi:hypothetical protein